MLHSDVHHELEPPLYHEAICWFPQIPSFPRTLWHDIPYYDSEVPRSNQFPLGGIRLRVARIALDLVDQDYNTTTVSSSQTTI